MTAVEVTAARPSAVLDEAHVGDIRGALGTIRVDDIGARPTLSAQDEDAARGRRARPDRDGRRQRRRALSRPTGRPGQNYGTRLLWTLLLLVPVLYVNQEMVLRLGAVTGVGHARLILQRFGKFWGAFEVFDLFILNALTIITEFIGITLAAGLPGGAQGPRRRSSRRP